MIYFSKLKNFISTLLILSFILFISACNHEKQNTNEEMPRLYPAPKTFPLKLGGEGYKINPFTGDSIKPIINKNGDTLKTGVPIPINLIPINDQIEKNEMTIIPRAYNIKPKVTPLKFIKKKKPEHFNTLAITKTLAKSASVEKTSSNAFLINISGDTIPTTGQPILTENERIIIKHPNPTKASYPRLKDYKSYDIRYIIEDESLGNSKIKYIYEDSRGDFWLSTGAGITKFDGENYWQYNEEVGFPLTITMNINEDKDGVLWFGTLEGIIKYDGEGFYHIIGLEEKLDFTVYSVIIDTSGYLWFGTSKGIFIYAQKQMWKYKDLVNNPSFVYSLVEDHAGNIWYAGIKNGLGMFDGHRIWSLNLSTKTNNTFVKTIFEDNRGALWFGTDGEGVFKYDEDSISKFTMKEGLIGNIVESISEDNEGNLWFGTYENGISCFNGKAFTNISINEGLSSNHITSTIKSKSGQLWIGTDEGVSIYNKKPFVYFNIADGLNGKKVNLIFEDKAGNIWLPSNFMGITIFDGENFKQYTEKEGLILYSVNTIFEDHSDNIWLGSYHNLWRFDGEKFYNYSNVFFDNNWISDIYEDSTGILWFGTTDDGIIKYDNTKFTSFKKIKSLHMQVRSVFEDTYRNLYFDIINEGLLMYNKEGFQEYSIGSDFNQAFPFFDGNNNMEIWFDTKYGIAKNSNNKIIRFTKKEGFFTYNKYRHLFQKNKYGNLLYADEHGLTVFDNKNFKMYTKKEGLLNNNIKSVINDRNGNIWLGSESGLSVIINQKNEKTDIKNTPLDSIVKVITYTRGQGLISDRFSLQTQPLLDSKNRIWWANDVGITLLDLNVFSINFNPKVRLRNIEINEHLYNYHNLQQSDSLGFSFTNVEPFYNYPDNLILDYDKNHLTFHFLSTVNFSSLHKIKYSYKIDGIDDSWSTITDRKIADYRNLPYGKHTFKVCALAEGSIWSEPFEYTFTISPPWWHTWWARTGYFILFILLIYGIIRWRTAKLKERQKELENQVDIATTEIREQKENIEIAHNEIKSSISYAKRIQNAILPPPRIVKEYLKDSFILYKPKDVVAGDFYWMEQKEGEVLFAAADCTGHGVPGAMVSVVCNNALNRSIREFALRIPGEILDKTREIVIEEFDKSSGDVKDGMDIALCSLEGNILQYAGAHNPLWIIRKGELLETKANKQPIGKFDNPLPYTTHTVNLEKGDTLYIFTDGFVDQFGGEKGKKFMVKAFRKLILSIQEKTMEEQKIIINQTFESWKGSLDQVDDVCVIGVRI